MTKRPTSSDIFDINRKTGALILGKNRLDDYATKYLTKHCREALLTPMALPVEDILQKEGLIVKEASLSRNHDIFGCCLLLDGEVELFDKETGKSRRAFFPAGTIIIDPDSEAEYGEGAKRNTLIHEALHWEKDKRFFEILAVKNAEVSEKLYPIMCRQSETFYEPPEGKKTNENEVKWLEWQAHRLAPRVLMPSEMFRKKTLELIDSYQQSKDGDFPSCDVLIEDLSDFFIVSRTSVKYRLIEIGLLDELAEFDDYDAVFADINSKKEFVPLSATEAYQLLAEDSSLREWVCGGRFIYADGYFVLANRKYVIAKNGELHLTPRAKRDLAQCVINITEQKYISYHHLQKDLTGFAILYKGEGIDRRLLTFHRRFQTNFEYEEDEVYSSFIDSVLAAGENEEIELAKMIGDPTTTLCQCLTFLMDNRGWKYPRTFREKTKLHENYYGKIKNDKYNNMGRDVLMAVCVGLGLTFRITEMIFNKSSYKLNYYQEPDKTYVHILEHMPGLRMIDFNRILEKSHLPKLGTIDDDEE